MKLCELLNVTDKATVIWITKDEKESGVFCGCAEDADANIPKDYLFGDVRTVYAEYYKGWDRSGISIVVEPYVSQ